MKALLFALVIVTIGGCSTTNYRNDQAERLVKVCGAGLSNSVATRAQALVNKGQGSVSLEVASEIKAAILNDANLRSADRLAAYESYLTCVKAGGIEVQLEDANSVVQNVQFTNDFKAASMFSSFDWVAHYRRAYKNIGDRTVECNLRVRGVIKKRSNGNPIDVGETDQIKFTVRPGKVYEKQGNVGIKGFSDNYQTVSTDDHLECWYL